MVNLRIGVLSVWRVVQSGSNIARFHAALTNTDYRTAFNALVSKIAMTPEKISPDIGLNAEAHNSQNADILNNVTMLHEKASLPR